MLSNAYSSCQARLRLFDIPRDNGTSDSTELETVRIILARLVSSGSLSFGELLTIRDMFDLQEGSPSWLYLMFAAMHLSRRMGNTYMQNDYVPWLLIRGCYDDAVSEAENQQFSQKITAEWQCHESEVAKVMARLSEHCPIVFDGGWYFQNDYHTVQTIKQHLKNLTAQPVCATVPDASLFQTATSFTGFQLNEQQLHAVKNAIENRFTVITGGPGTGKTTIVFSILRMLMQLENLNAADIALATPTGRAAQRMGEALRSQCTQATRLSPVQKEIIASLNGCTIHSLLGGMAPEWRHNAQNPLPHKLIIIDESSMLDIELAKALLEALPDNSRLIFLGDKDQLPSVEAGAVLGDIIVKHSTNIVYLTESQRFKGLLKQCAREINQGVGTTVKSSQCRIKDPTETTWLEAVNSPERDNSLLWISPNKQEMSQSFLEKHLIDWAKNFGLLQNGELVSFAEHFDKQDASLVTRQSTPASQRLFFLLDQARILTVVREGIFGANGINRTILMQRYQKRAPENPFLIPGIPVMIQTNCPERNLFNGDIGITIETERGMVALFSRGDTVVQCPILLLPEHTLAYAITIHKSQGSEFRNVLVVLPNDIRNPLLNRPLLYTGITRAKSKAVVLSSEKSLDQALSTTIIRNTGI